MQVRRKLVSGNSLSDYLASPRVDIDAMLERMRPIEGWFNDEEAGLLTAAVTYILETADNAAIVEIGSYHGRSTVVLADVMSAVRPEQRVCAIDPHEGRLSLSFRPDRLGTPTFDIFCSNLLERGLLGSVEVIRSRSADVDWDRPIGLLFIDGLHDYRNISTDFQRFSTWIIPSGFVAFHDYSPNFPDVIRLVNEVQRHGDFVRVADAGDLVVLRRKAADTG